MGEMDRGWWRGKLVLVLMGRATLSKSLIQFSVDGWSCVPFLLFDLRPNYGGGNEDNGDLLPRSHAHTAALSASNPAAGHCWPLPLLQTPGHSRTSLGQALMGHCSFLLGPGVHKVLFVPSKSLFPQVCVSSGGSMVGIMATSFKRAYVIPRFAAPRVPAPAAGHCWPVPLQKTLKHSSGSVCVGVSGSWYAQGLFEPSEHLWWLWGLILNMILPLLPSWWGFSFALGCGVSFFGRIQHSPVNRCSAVSCNFGVLVGEDEHMSFYSAILKLEQHSVVDVTGNGSKVQCCKEQYCIGTWDVRPMNQGKLEVVKQEMARVYIDILWISELK